MGDSAQTNKLIVIAVIALVIGAAIGYGASSLTMVPAAVYNELNAAYEDLQALPYPSAISRICRLNTSLFWRWFLRRG